MQAACLAPVAPVAGRAGVAGPSARAVQRAVAPRSAPKQLRKAVRAALRVAAAAGNGATSVPEPVVKIDNEADPFATVVTIQFGDRLGELLDTVASLRGLGLNIRRAKLKQGQEHRFYVTDERTSEKVVKSSKIEEIRLTILQNMMEFHPESQEQLAWGSGAARSAVTVRDVDPTAPLGVRRGIQTQVEVREHETGSHSVLLVNTVDRPGLLTDIVRVLKDINLNVVSAEVDTIGRNAVDRFNVTYHGEPLEEPMAQLAVNALQYYLSQGEVEKEWSESY
ncbi:hypothetical protein C2E21_1907 isoform A [Chlorella sorokiniana]|uniref:ACT domain-containing protein n=1 Tax=Chlorella sorokiniana TaxID=3076 RepID=A0A2P6U164_CHLSO|nr:hypothetical protein C2E21_1907 isoform A [Chlorella sorokiniana]|eukprot:PRW60057.1 hypothetical protein C2E21_1907 isoform A [Chlorella sorokiniana]